LKDQNQDITKFQAKQQNIEKKPKHNTNNSTTKQENR
jgi:hypothetical protein